MRLRECATSLATLNPRDDEETGLITFALAAICYATQSGALGFSRHQSWRDRRKDVLALAHSIGRGDPLPTNGQWLAVVNFNSALFRVDVGFERVTRYVTKLSGNESWKELSNKAAKHGLSPKLLEPWSEVRDEVNALKHRNPEALRKPRLSQAQLVDALESLVKAIEWALSPMTP